VIIFGDICIFWFLSGFGGFCGSHLYFCPNTYLRHKISLNPRPILIAKTRLGEVFSFFFALTGQFFEIQMTPFLGGRYLGVGPRKVFFVRRPSYYF